MEIELVGDPLDPYVQRVAVTLEALDLAYTARETDPREAEDELKEIHPLGAAPVLLVDGEPLFSAAAINEFLDDLGEGGLLPADALERARARSWISFSDACQEELDRTVEAPDEKAFHKSRAELYYKLGRLEAERGGTPFWSGRTPGLVDFTYAPLLMRLEYLARRTGSIDLSGFPNLEDWTYELVGHHAVKAVMPSEREDAHLELLQGSGGYVAKMIRA